MTRRSNVTLPRLLAGHRHWRIIVDHQQTGKQCGRERKKKVARRTQRAWLAAVLLGTLIVGS